jgi:hypothetical protein
LISSSQYHDGLAKKLLLDHRYSIKGFLATAARRNNIDLARFLLSRRKITPDEEALIESIKVQSSCMLKLHLRDPRAVIGQKC